MQVRMHDTPRWLAQTDVDVAPASGEESMNDHELMVVPVDCALVATDVTSGRVD